MSEKSRVYELDSGDYKYTEYSDWIQNDGRGNINLDWEKWFDHEKSSLNSKVKKQIQGFKSNLYDNLYFTDSNVASNFRTDFNTLEKELNKAINNATLGPASRKTYISVAENLRTNEIDRIEQALTMQGFDGKLIPDGNIQVSYYDKDGNYTPKDSWTVKNDGRATFITHNETGLELKLDRNGLSFVDNNKFKVSNKIIDYGDINTPRNVNFYPTGDEFDPMPSPPPYEPPLPDKPPPPPPAEPFTAEDFETVKNNVANNIDKKFNAKGMGLKVLDVVGKVAGPIDEILMWGAKQGLPKLFAGTALAGASSVVGTGLFYGWMAWTLGNLSVAAIKGAGKFAGEFGGDTMKALEAISNGQLPEKDWTDAFTESLKEGFGDFSNQMQYDPSVMLIDSVTEKVFGFNQTDPLIKTYQFGKQGIQNLFGGRK